MAEVAPLLPEIVSPFDEAPRDLPPDNVVHLESVGVRRGQSWLLADVSWSVSAEERWVVMGPNGAGKTTMLRVVSTLAHPSVGRAWVLGERLGTVSVWDLRPRIGMASAALAERVPPGERAGDVVMSAAWAVVGRGREVYGAVDVARAQSLLERWGVGGFADRSFGTLSEGERKRVQIARALMADPELLLLDEPAAGLDLGGREDLVGRLAMLARDPYAPTLVLVTHHVEEIPLGITHALLLRDGRALAAGPLGEVMTAESLSDCFGMSLRVDRSADGRWAARRA